MGCKHILEGNNFIQGDTKNGKFRKTQQKLKNSKEKKLLTEIEPLQLAFLRDSNPNYQCLKITSCRWRPPPRMHSFTATTHLKSSRSFVSPCVCCMLCRMRQSRILQSMQHTHLHAHIYMLIRACKWSAY